MIFRQFIHQDLACASYMVGDLGAGAVAVVDPKFEIDEYLETARYLGVSIEHVLETHNHADHVSGHGRIAAATGATIHIHRLADAGYAHEPFEDGWELELGDLRIRAVHTPGHRPEHTIFTLTDTARSDEPWAVLTGDTLFVGDIARPDLAIDKEEGARGIFRALHDKLLSLPGETEVWPGHLGGSMCGGPGMDLKVSSTIGYERRANPLLAETDEDAFVERTTEALGAQPPNFHAIVDINRGPLVREGVEAHPLAPRQVDLKRQEGAFIVDVRTLFQFDDAHVPGSVVISILQAGFGSKLAWLADPEQEVVFVGRDDADGRRATELAQSVGIRSVGGFLAGGMTSWREEGRPAGSIERIGIDALAARREREPDLQILDVREPPEWREVRIPGSAFVPYHDIHELPDAIDPGRPVAAICSSGIRSGTAASLLRRYGAGEVLHVVDGGVPLWGRRGYPVEEGEPART